MNVKERLLLLELLNKQKKHPKLFANFGIKVIVQSKK